MIGVILWIVERYGDNFFITLLSVNHRHHANRITPNKAEPCKWLTAQNKNIEWVAVLAERQGNKAVVHWIVCAGVKHPVHSKQACFLVEFILGFITLLNFNASHKIFWCYSFFINFLPNVHINLK